jgi:predicted RNase H-like HicB family nuclease
VGKARERGRAGPAIDRPFDPKVLERARKIVERYQVVVWFEEGEWYGRGVELPNAMNDGKTAEQCVTNTRDILVTTVAYLIESGEAPPPPARDNLRTEQVNVRLTVEEKMAVEAAAQRKGFRGIGDFMRSAALAGTGV